ncbi:c-type cytochrome [Ramlibacter sp. USB13]|uniref:C-type cytochrome n=1 Tax=Ramlibacter cellulosilyticus TaxID=2764187 RepID=A0A923MSP5_9BURK|nr:c-type cytochrome [Ramlibacter cellulosilyticus]MBC5783112.1 c-type cytochrome [Ramlibacter cellulosilyticus]
MIRITTRLLLCTLVAVAASHAAAQAPADPATVPAFRELDSMEARVQGCATCHGQQGQGTNNDYFPRIAGKPAGYLFNQLRAFRDGSRRYAPMNYLVAYMSDAYLQEIAEHFAALRPPFPQPQPATVAADFLDRGRTLVQNGDGSRQIPPCMACHGARLTGMVPGIPGLVGLRPNYIAAQLTRWRTGERRAAEPDCMHRIATRLADADIQALAAYLGSLAAPQDHSPDPRNVQRMPVACGSQR